MNLSVATSGYPFLTAYDPPGSNEHLLDEDGHRLRHGVAVSRPFLVWFYVPVGLPSRPR